MSELSYPPPPFSRSPLRGAHRIVLGGVVAALAVTGWLGAPVASADASTVKIKEIGLTQTSSAQRQDAARRAADAQSQRSTGSEQPVAAETVIASLPAKEVAKFSTIGVTWSGGINDPIVEVQTRSQGAWSAWTRLSDGTAESTDEASGARMGTDPIWVGDSDAVAVRMLSSSASATVADPQVSLIDAGTAATDPRGVAAASVAAPGLAAKPKIVTRAGWGANESLKQCKTPEIDETIQASIVHHTAGSNSYTAAQSASIVRGIFSYHTQSLGWCDVGYNFLVDKYGTIFEGRAGGVDLPVHGAHATSWNTNTVGVSMMGNHDTVKPSAATLESVAKVIAWKFDANYRDPKGKVSLAGKTIDRISGHGDVMQTACPGRYGFAALPGLRNRVATLVGSWKTPIYTRWMALGGDKGSAGPPRIGERVIKDGRYTQFKTYDIFSSVDTGAHLVKGAIRTKYRALGNANHALGFPISDQIAGPSAGSTQSRFEDGAIMHSSATGAVVIRGGIYRSYTAIADAGTHLGLPTKPEAPLASAGNVPVQEFQKGRIYWIGGSGRAVYGRIWTEYKRLGAEKSALSRPSTSEQAGPVAGTRQNTFEKGIILYSGATGARAVTGSFWTAYAKLSAGDKARLGVPIEAQRAANGAQVQGFTGGAITADAAGTVRVAFG